MWKITTHPLTLVSSTANVFIAPCILSKLVLFQTKSTLNPWPTSTGTPYIKAKYNVRKKKIQLDLELAKWSNKLTIEMLPD